MTDAPTGHPDVTFALIAYNQEKYVREAVEGAFAQTYQPLEIILSDDCSTDRTFGIMEEMVAAYRGPHRIVLNKNPENIGLIAHVNRIFEIASHDYIIAAAGDDVSLPHRAERIAQIINAEQPFLIHSRYHPINEEGRRLPPEVPKGSFHISTDPVHSASSLGLYVGATGVWHKDLVRKYGPISYPDAYEDLVLGFRAALEGRVAFVDEELICYRVGAGMSRKPSLFEKSRWPKLTRIQLSRVSSLKQRIEDMGQKFSTSANSETNSILTDLNQTLYVQEAFLKFYQNPWIYLIVNSWKPKILQHYLRRVARKIQRIL